jgi:predicted nucleotidyltransferase
MEHTAHLAQEEVLREIVLRLTSEFAPRKILLYGSRATGTARSDSDYDLLIGGGMKILRPRVQPP